MSDTLFIPDADRRARALDPRESFIVQAPAGSGKTELLTQRYLNLLATVNAPEEIIAITFTRKAAGEMRNRILAALDQAAEQEQPPDGEHKRRTWQLARAALARDTEKNWRLRANPARLRVQTFDALCSTLTRQMPMLSRFGAPPSISDDPEQLYREAAGRTLKQLESEEDWSAAVAHLLEHLDNNWQTLENLLTDMLARRDQWLRHIQDFSRPELEAALGRLITDSLARIEADLPGWLKTEVLPPWRFAAGNLLARGDSSPIIYGAEANEFPACDPAALPQWQGLAELLLTGKNEWRRQVTKREGFPAAGAGMNAEEKKQAKVVKDAMVGILAGLRENGHSPALLALARLLPPPRYDHSQWQTLLALRELLRLAAAQLEVVFQARGEVDFSAMSQAAQRALGEPEAPTDLALALDYRVSHLLIDEFQDTSLSQFLLLETLTAGWQADDGRTFFAVGDPMQSIYRFREAEVGLYLRARRHGLGQLRPVPLTLEVNFRSQGGVVDWVNQAFGRIFPAREDIATGAVPYSPSTAIQAALEGEAVRSQPADDEAAEAREILELTRQLRAERGASIAVLVRSRSHLRELIPLFRREGLRFRALDIEKLGERQVARDLSALTRALNHPADRVAWLGLLRAPWCGLSLNDLHALAGGDAREATLIELMQDPARRQGLSLDGLARLERLEQVMRPALNARRRQSLRQWVENTWLALGGPACVTNDGDLEDAQVFFDLLDNLDEGGELHDFARLEKEIAELFAQPDVGADPGLQIMTVHKSKGLEFDYVIFPGLGRSTPPEASRLLIWLERPRSGAGHDLLMAPIKAAEAPQQDAIYRCLRQLDKDKGKFEDQRLLYVAATRAKKRLYLLATIRDASSGPSSDTLLAPLWPVVAPIFARHPAGRAAGEAPPKAAEGGSSAEPVNVLRRLTLDWRAPEPPPALEIPRASETPPTEPDEEDEEIEFRWAGETARHIGSVVHRLLQRLTQRGRLSLDPQQLSGLRQFARNALTRLGVPEAQLENARERVEQAVRRALADPRGQWIMRPDHHDAHCEYALTGARDQQLKSVIMDRTFVDEQGIRWIIDYKTGLHQGGAVEEFLDREQQRYRRQLEEYAALFRLREQRPIRLGLYFPLLPGWREWEYQNTL